MTTAYLPEIFRPRQNDALARIGKHNDGGYVVDLNTIKEAKLLVSMGINRDWSFEDQFRLISDIPILAFDASISRMYFSKLLIKAIRTLNPKHILEKYRLYRSYTNFFDGKLRKHIGQYVGFDLEPKNLSLRTLASHYLGDLTDGIFFKIDIEGSEYRILNDLISIQDRTVGLVIEFHDFDIHIERIAKFIADYKLSICHIHVNNFADINSHLPLSIELSFSRYNGTNQSECQYPTELDMPNNPNRLDPEIRFINS